MTAVRAVFAYTFREHVRHRAWLSAALFGLVLMGGGVVASALAQDERGRLMLDLGLAANEAIGLVTMVFLSVNLVLREIESRAVFLLLTRPVRRSHYLLGRYLGTLGAVAAAMAAMAAVHWCLLAALGWASGASYPAALLCSVAKTAMMGALALLLSLALTSEAAATAFAGFLWILGHFTGEMRFVAEKSGSPPLRAAIGLASRAVPDFALLNYRDAWHAAPPGAGWVAQAVLYAAAYTAVCLLLAAQVLEEREF